MSNLAQRPPLGQKFPIIRGTVEARKHMTAVAQLPCVVCQQPGPSEVHHCIHGRYGSRKVSDFETIPLCYDCHRGPKGIHADKTAWAALNGFDHEFLPMVADMLCGIITIPDGA